MKTFLKSEQIQLFYKKIIGRKLIISKANKMQRLLNVSKAIQTIPAGFLKKWEPITKYPKNKLSLVTEVDEPKISFVVKHCEIPKFKTNCYHQSQS